MKTRFLFPHRYRLVGWLIFIPAFIHGLPYVSFVSDDNVSMWTKVAQYVKASADSLPYYHYQYTDEIVLAGIIVGLMLIAFSQESVEDEMISQLRLEALQWSVYANYLVLLIAIATVYDVGFLNVMVYNLFTMLLVFIARFRYLIYRNDHQLTT